MTLDVLLSRYPLFAPADEAGAENAGEPDPNAAETASEDGGEPAAGESGEQATDQDDSAGEQTGGGDEPAKPGERPEYVPEDLWDAENGQIKAEDAFKELQQLRDEKAEREQASEDLPEKPDGYELKLPEDFELPEGVEWQFDENDPRLPMARELAHEFGLGQKAFERLLSIEAKTRLDEHQSEMERLQEERKALGDTADDRIKQVDSWLKKNLTQEQAEALSGVATTAAGVKAVESLMKMTNRARTGAGSETGPANQQTKSRAERMFGGTAK